MINHRFLEAELSDFAPITDADFPDISKKQFMAYCRAKSGKVNINNSTINTLDECFGAWCADDYSTEDMIRDIDEVCKDKTDFIQEML